MSKQKPYPPQLEKEIGQFVRKNNHLNKYDIAEHFGTNPEWVWKIAHACGVRLAFAPRPPKEKNIEHREFIKRNPQMTLKQMAAELGESKVYLRSLADRFNLPYERERNYTVRPRELLSNEFFNLTARENWLI